MDSELKKLMASKHWDNAICMEDALKAYPVGLTKEDLLVFSGCQRKKFHAVLKVLRRKRELEGGTVTGRASDRSKGVWLYRLGSSVRDNLSEANKSAYLGIAHLVRQDQKMQAITMEMLKGDPLALEAYSVQRVIQGGARALIAMKSETYSLMSTLNQEEDQKDKHDTSYPTFDDDAEKPPVYAHRAPKTPSNNDKK